MRHPSSDKSVTKTASALKTRRIGRAASYLSGGAGPTTLHLPTAAAGHTVLMTATRRNASSRRRSSPLAPRWRAGSSSSAAALASSSSALSSVCSSEPRCVPTPRKYPPCLTEPTSLRPTAAHGQRLDASCMAPPHGRCAGGAAAPPSAVEREGGCSMTRTPPAALRLAAWMRAKSPMAALMRASKERSKPCLELRLPPVGGLAGTQHA
mmetsp:Transcript_45004/g.146194  ORF Transcript_45004/g.146194 Transcript_45004/m.146194 type:complete len:209 (+) Transcript_45004:55-681(+)